MRGLQLRASPVRPRGIPASGNDRGWLPWTHDVHVDRQLAFAHGSGARGLVEFGDLHQQAAGREASGVEGVEGADLREAFGDRSAGM